MNFELAIFRWCLLLLTPDNEIYTCKIFVRRGTGMFKISSDYFSPIVNLDIFLFRTLYVNCILSILFQSDILKIA